MSTATAERRQLRAGRGADQVRHAVGHEPVHRQRLRVPPRPEAEHELLLQRGQRPAQERADAQPVGRARRRADRHSRRLRRPRQGVLLLQLRAAPVSAEQHAHARHPEPARAAGHLPVPGRRRGQPGEPATPSRPPTARPRRPIRRSPRSSTKIRTGTGTTGIINNRTDPNTQDYLWQPESLRIDNSPGGRIDYNLTSRHRLSSELQLPGPAPDARTCSAATSRTSPACSNQADLYSAVSRGSATLRSTFGAGLVNELRVGISNAPVWFADQVDLEPVRGPGRLQHRLPQRRQRR